MFVLVSLYGADVSISRMLDIESQSLYINFIHPVELRSLSTNSPYLLFTLKETTTVLQKWTTSNQYQLESGIYEYIHAVTNGHLGMIGSFLRIFDTYVLKV